MKPKTKTRIMFDFDGKWRDSFEKLSRIICSSHWASGINVIMFDSHKLLIELVKLGVIVIDECEYELQEQLADSEKAWEIEWMLGKRSSHPVLREMAALFDDEPYEMADCYRNTIYLPNLKAYVRADGMKPEDIAEMLVMAEKIILFPYFPLDDKSAYYELMLGIEKEKFVDFMNHIKEQQENEMYEAIMQAEKRSTAGYQVILRNEKKSDWKTVEQITYRAFCDAPPTGADDDGMEALLARKLRRCAAFVPELDFVAELNGSVIGNIMYTRSKVAGDSGEWETLTFGPVSVLPKYQRQGVGSALIRKTLEIARDLGYRAVLIFGYESYYPRFGFKPSSEFGITTADGKNFPAFMALPLYNDALDGVRGRLICDEAYFTLDRDESDKLNAKLAEPMDIDEYIAMQSKDVQPILHKVREIIRATAPDAAEKISWQMPTFRQGKNLLHFCAQKKHLGIYSRLVERLPFADRLAKYKSSKGAIQFPYNKPIDYELIADIVKWRFT